MALINMALSCHQGCSRGVRGSLCLAELMLAGQVDPQTTASKVAFNELHSSTAISHTRLRHLSGLLTDLRRHLHLPLCPKGEWQ